MVSNQKMEVAEIMREVRKLPDDQLLALAAEVEEAAARAVDQRFADKVGGGVFAHLAADALREDKEGRTSPLHEVLDEHRIS